METEVERLQKIIDDSRNIVFFGGAGVSTESDIPDFRSADGLYHQQYKYTPEQIVGRLAYACGLQTEPAPRTPAQLLPDFDWAKVPRQDICLPEGLF